MRGNESDPNETALSGSRMSRRRLVSAAGALALPVVGAGAMAQASRQIATPMATPVATPVATPMATPVAGTPEAATPVATPIATPVPPPLVVVREQQPSYDSTPQPGGTLHLVRPPADSADFNPTSFRQDYQVLVSYLDPLVRPDPLTLEPTPWLAESWAISADGREVRFTLRSDVRWHDGSPFTAEDVRFSLLVYRDDYDTAVRNLFAVMDDVEVVDVHQIRVVLAAADPSWLFNAATQLIFQAAQYADYWNAAPPGERSLAGFRWTDDLPIGTGPWEIESIRLEGVEFTRNANYWQAPPWFDHFSLAWVESPRDRIDAWRGGDADLVWPLRTEDIPLVEDIPGRLYVAEAASVMFAAFNFANPTGLPRFFDDLRLREALTLAVNRRRFAEEVFRGFVDVQAAGTVAQAWAHDEGVRAPEHDPETALELLAAAGWSDFNGDGTLENGAGVPFDLTVVVRDDARRELIQVLRSLKADWSEIGVALRIQLLPADQFQERALRGHDFDLIAYAYDLYPGFTDFDLYGTAWDIRTNPQGWNPGGYSNPAVDEAIAAYLQATDVDDQRAALQRLQQAANEDLFGIWLGFPAGLILAAVDIDGFQPNTLWQTADTRLLWRTDRRSLTE